MHKIPNFDLPHVTRCRLINTFCFSKVVYLDQFVPATSATLESLTLAAASTVSGGEGRPLLPYTILLRRLPAGGFGLFDLSTQLHDARAQWIRRLLFEPQAQLASLVVGGSPFPLCYLPCLPCLA
ncbi:hypothetical protein V1507DRAFT_196358 [Lipomyces tetrasporus]